MTQRARQYNSLRQPRFYPETFYGLDRWAWQGHATQCHQRRESVLPRVAHRHFVIRQICPFEMDQDSGSRRFGHQGVLVKSDAV